MVKVFQNNLEPGFPSFITQWFSRVTDGEWSLISEGYADQNKKRGAAWEASREVEVTDGQRLFSVIELGSLPLDIKARTLGGSGEGLTGRMYRLAKDELDLAPYLGGEEKIYNKHRDVKFQSEFKLYAVDPADIITDGDDLDLFLADREVAAGIHIRTNTQNQAKGFLSSTHNSDSIFDPLLSDDLVLLEIESHSNQWITAYLDIYEGELDFRLKPE